MKDRTVKFKRILILCLTAILATVCTAFAQPKNDGSSPSLAPPSPTAAADPETPAQTSPMIRLTVWIVLLTILFVVLILLQRKLRGRGISRLKPEAFEVLGTAPLAFRHQMYVMRCGNKVFLASLSQNGMDRIGEIDDPAEVERLTRLCRGEVLGTKSSGTSSEGKG